ncbi:sulfatase [Planctomycetes bacterium K23_9]|uniref:Arylsulfatase n=1 Tax=Stieleria marina TaxID=1930275 RepID=A0A517NQL9_9BACT|nr:Arylsulfatase [Planctomycetes bacterium K23_9]
MIKSLSIALICVLATAVVADDRPNIIFLMSDDQATYSMGCYGTPGAKTPNLDQLAKDGMIFDRHYDTTAICMASRANVFTGKYEYKTGCNFEHGPMMQEIWAQSYPVLLRRAGYKTAFAGKFGLEVLPTEQQNQKKSRLPEEDFDVWGGGPGQTSYATKKNVSMAKYAKEFPHSTRSYGAFGRDFIQDSATGDQPFCLSISFKAPHHPVQPDPNFDDVYRGAKFTKPANYGRQAGSHLSLQSREGRQYERFHSWNYADDYDTVMAKYYQQIYAIDVAVGMIRQAIDDAGVADNTVIIYTSDNGFMNGSHGYGSKVIPYEESSRVPLIIFDPRHPNSGKEFRCDELTGNVDFQPTILKLAGLPVADEVDGKDLMPLYQDPKTAIRTSLPLINVWGPKKVHSFGVVTKNWKYVYWPYDDGDFEKSEELFDMVNDTGEMKNLADVTSDTPELQSMRKRYDRAVNHWQQNAVPYHNYQPFAELFRRR